MNIDVFKIDTKINYVQPKPKKSVAEGLTLN